jgi:hypothetical protein
MGGIAIRLAAYLGVLAALGILIIELLPVGQSAATAALPERPQWTAMDRPHAAFAVTFPDIPGQTPAYVVMRSAAGGGRKDVMSVEGQGRNAGRLAMLEVYRPGNEFTGFGSAEAEIQMRAAPSGAVEALSPAPAIESRFGALELVDFTRLRNGRPQGCLGFVSRVDQPQLQISGWVCNAGPGMVARTAVNCALDRLTLLSAGNDPKLAEFFAKAELKEGFCNPRAARAGTPGRPADWLSGRAETRLRGAAAK